MDNILVIMVKWADHRPQLEDIGMNTDYWFGRIPSAMPSSKEIRATTTLGNLLEEVRAINMLRPSVNRPKQNNQNKTNRTNKTKSTESIGERGERGKKREKIEKREKDIDAQRNDIEKSVVLGSLTLPMTPTKIYSISSSSLLVGFESRFDLDTDLREESKEDVENSQSQRPLSPEFNSMNLKAQENYKQLKWDRPISPFTDFSIDSSDSNDEYNGNNGNSAYRYSSSLGSHIDDQLIPIMDENERLRYENEKVIQDLIDNRNLTNIATMKARYNYYDNVSAHDELHILLANLRDIYLQQVRNKQYLEERRRLIKLRDAGQCSL
tara:strand:- start:145 stop:1116 length:972 start_codon:yes stop_codon:yes gene_type:complete